MLSRDIKVFKKNQNDNGKFKIIELQITIM